MRLLLFLVIIISVVLETTQVTIPLTASLLTAAALIVGRQAAGVLFAGGILLDLFSLRLLGQSSIYFLLIGAATTKYQRKVFAETLPYTVAILFVSTAIYQWLFSGRIDATAVAISTMIALALLWVVNRMGTMGWKGRKGLRL